MGKTIRVLYIQPYNWECGPHQSLRLLISGLDRTRFSTSVVLPAPSVIAEELAEHGAEILFDPGVSTVPRSFSPFRQLTSLTNICTSGFRLSRLIRHKDIDLVHVNSEACWVGGFAARLAGVPAITHLRGLSVLTPRWVGYLTVRILNRFNEALIATSCEVQKAFAACGTDKKLLRMIYNGIDMEKFNPAHAVPVLRSELDFEDGQPLIGMIANFDARKGHDHFIKACALVSQKISNAHFVFIGNTHFNDNKVYYEKIQRLIKKHNLTKSVHFLGSRDDIPNVMASLDVVVQPSLTEAGPRVPIEAMAMERPIIVSDIGGNSEEVINGQTGLVVPVGDIHAFAKAIMRILSNARLAMQIGKAGRKRVMEMFSKDRHVQEISRLYEQLVKVKHIS
jgi:glycosyltransferase involved in cell wall biosynthesis